MSTIPQPGEKHLTASVWITTPSTPKKVLLIFHKKLQKWMQPGGHVEQFENPLETAIREVKEELGIDISSHFKTEMKGDCTLLPSPVFFFEEPIPPYKEQTEHFHLDCMYHLELPQQTTVKEESAIEDVGWFTLEETETMPLHENSRYVLKQLLS